MTSRDFAYWLQGFFELENPSTVDSEQLQVIKNHLNLVFKHEIDPSIDNNDPIKSEDYQSIHDGRKFNPENVSKVLRC